jgi:hypothetical protein
MTKIPTAADDFEFYLKTDFEDKPVGLLATDWGDEFYWDKGTKQWTSTPGDVSWITRDDTELITEERANEIIAGWA